MVATAERGLSPADLDSIRSTLESGRKPKVVFTASAGQIAGQTGQVVELLDPPVDEWVVVRFGRDELPFSPADLAIPPKGAARAKTAAKAAEPSPDDVAPAAPSIEVPYERPLPVPPPREEARAVPETPETEPAVPAQAAADAKPRKAARAPKVKPPATLTVTLSYTDGDWMVGAQQGSKALAKPYVIKAAEALRMVALLDVPGVHEAVEQIVSAERAETEAQADRLRAELAEIEARLADLPHTGH